MPIKINDSDKNTEELLSNLNGVILPGGNYTPCFDANGDLTKYGAKVKLIVDKVKQINENGNYFPLWCICLGFQAVISVETMDPKILAVEKFDSKDKWDILKFVCNDYDSKQFKNWPSNLIEALQTEEITYNYHVNGFDPESFETNKVLSEDYTLVATTTDRKGVEYAAIYEHKRYPIYGHQSHPEKIEHINYDKQAIPKTENAVAVARYLAKFFVDECRLNFNKFESVDELESSLLSNNPLIHIDGNPQDIYVFNE